MVHPLEIWATQRPTRQGPDSSDEELYAELRAAAQPSAAAQAAHGDGHLWRWLLDPMVVNPWVGK